MTSYVRKIKPGAVLRCSKCPWVAIKFQTPRFKTPPMVRAWNALVRHERKDHR